MKISEAIKKLKKIKKEKGDLDIKIEDIFEGYAPDTDLGCIDIDGEYVLLS